MHKTSLEKLGNFPPIEFSLDKDKLEPHVYAFMHTYGNIYIHIHVYL